MADKFVFSNFATSALREAISAADSTLLINIDDVPRFPTLAGGAKFPLILAASEEQVEIVYVTALTLAGVATVERGREGTQPQSWLAGQHVRHSITANTLIVSAGLKPRGTWSAAVAYAPGDMVEHNGIAYAAVLESLNQPPAGGSTYWQLFYQPAGAASTAMNFQGIWNSSTTYAVGQVVNWAGRTWQANAGNTNSPPAYGNANWTHFGVWSGLARHEGILAFLGLNNYTVSIAGPEAPTQLYDGLTVKGRFAQNNTAAATLTINALAPVPLRFRSGILLGAGDIVAGELYTFTYAASSGEFISEQPVGLTADLLGAAQVPIGMVMDWPGSGAIPPKWLYCNGQAVSRVTYAALFAVLSTTYGAGDGVNTFNLPDYQGRATFGREGMGGVTVPNRLTAYLASGTTGQAAGSQHMQIHNHGVNDPTHGHGMSDPTHIHAVTDPTHAHTTLQFSDNGSWSVGALTGSTGIQLQGDNVGALTGFAATGISVNPAGTGIAIFAAATGVTTQNAGGGGYGNLPPMIITDKIIFAGV